MKHLLAVFLWCACAGIALAQDTAQLGIAAIRLSQHLMPLCGRTNFSANLRAEVYGPAGEHKMTLAFRSSIADGHYRQDILLLELPNLPVATRQGLKQLGVDTLTVVFRPEEAKVYVAHIPIRAYCVLDLTAAMLEEMGGERFNFQETPLGSEEIEGEVCAKVQSINLEHPSEVAILWRSQKLDGFPVKIETRGPQGTMNVRLTHVDLKQPSPDIFMVPTNYVKLPNTKAFGPYAIELFKRQHPQPAGQSAGQPAAGN